MVKVKLELVERYPCLSIDKEYIDLDEEFGDVYEVPSELIEEYLQKEKELLELEMKIRKYMENEQ